MKCHGIREAASLMFVRYEAYLHRWRSLNVNSDCGAGLYTLVNDLRWSPPNIQHFQIRLNGSLDDDEIEAWGPTNGIFKDATSVRLQGVGPHWCRPPLTAVTTLELYRCFPGMIIDFSMLRSMLNGLSALRHLALCIDILHDWLPENIELPSLKSLHLSIGCEVDEGDDDNGIYIIDFLEAISAPDLGSLLIEFTQRHHLQSFALECESKFSSLVSVTISIPRFDLPIHSTMWYRVSDHVFRYITHLTVLYKAIDSVLEVLQHMAGQMEYLETVTLIGVNPRKMISERTASSHSIRKLQLSPSIMAGLALDWLRGRVEVELSTVYPESSRHSHGVPYVVAWPDYDHRSSSNSCEHSTHTTSTQNSAVSSPSLREPRHWLFNENSAMVI
jgi:hypothetical protein